MRMLVKFAFQKKTTRCWEFIRIEDFHININFFYHVNLDVVLKVILRERTLLLSKIVFHNFMVSVSVIGRLSGRSLSYCLARTLP